MPRYIMEGSNEPEFRSLDPFTRGYIEAMFWTEEAPGVTTKTWQQPGFEPVEGSIPGDVGFCDLAPRALAAIKRDCARFQEQCKAVLAVAEDRRAPEYLGHDFWLTRNGHGTGFWDREELEYVPPVNGNTVSLGTALTNAAKRLGEVNVYLGDDGKVYL